MLPERAPYQLLIIQNGMKWVLRATYLPLPYTFIDNIQ